MRTYVITGAASGIGLASRRLLEADGHTVIGVDLREAEVVADLSTPEGRAGMVRDVESLSGGTIDGLLAVAGLASDTVATAKVNYFGMIATLEGLRPLLTRSSAPRAAAVVSMSVIFPNDERLAAAFEEGDEAAAITRAGQITGEPGLIYTTSKRAVARWVRRMAPTTEWAGEGIALNAVAPGVVETPMMAEQLSTQEGRKAAESMVPMPLNGILKPEDVAVALRWLTSVEAGRVCGQILFVDAGADAVIRGDSVLPFAGSSDAEV